MSERGPLPIHQFRLRPPLRDLLYQYVSEALP